MILTLLGSGDAIGTPKIGCQCETCIQALETGRERLRTSLLVSVEGRHIIIDTSPDLRTQLLACGSPRIDAVIWTHGHYDHFAGYTEFYRIQKMPPANAASSVIDYICEQLHFLDVEGYGREPYEPFTLFGVDFLFFKVNHPPADAFGVLMEYKGKKIVYTGDTRKDIPQESLDLLCGADLMFVDAIVPGGITIGKHMNYDDATSLACELGVRDFRCICQSHLIPWDLPNCGTDGECFHF